MRKTIDDDDKKIFENLGWIWMELETACKCFQVSPKTLLYWLSNSVLPVQHKGKNKYPAEDVLDVVRTNHKKREMRQKASALYWECIRIQTSNDNRCWIDEVLGEEEARRKTLVETAQDAKNLHHERQLIRMAIVYGESAFVGGVEHDSIYEQGVIDDLIRSGRRKKAEFTGKLVAKNPGARRRKTRSKSSAETVTKNPTAKNRRGITSDGYARLFYTIGGAR